MIEWKFTRWIGFVLVLEILTLSSSSLYASPGICHRKIAQLSAVIHQKKNELEEYLKRRRLRKQLQQNRDRVMEALEFEAMHSDQRDSGAPPRQRAPNRKYSAGINARLDRHSSSSVTEVARVKLAGLRYFIAQRYEHYDPHSNFFSTSSVKRHLLPMATSPVRLELPRQTLFTSKTIVLPLGYEPCGSSDDVDVYDLGNGNFEYLSTASLPIISLKPSPATFLTKEEVRRNLELQQISEISLPHPLLHKIEEIRRARHLGLISERQTVGSLVSFVTSRYQYQCFPTAEIGLDRLLQSKAIQCTGTSGAINYILRKYFKIPVRATSAFLAKHKAEDTSLSVAIYPELLHMFNEVYFSDTQRWEEVDATPTDPNGNIPASSSQTNYIPNIQRQKSDPSAAKSSAKEPQRSVSGQPPDSQSQMNSNEEALIYEAFRDLSSPRILFESLVNLQRSTANHSPGQNRETLRTKEIEKIRGQLGRDIDAGKGERWALHHLDALFRSLKMAATLRPLSEPEKNILDPLQSIEKKSPQKSNQSTLARDILADLNGPLLHLKWNKILKLPENSEEALNQVLSSNPRLIERMIVLARIRSRLQLPIPIFATPTPVEKQISVYDPLRRNHRTQRVSLDILPDVIEGLELEGPLSSLVLMSAAGSLMGSLPSASNLSGVHKPERQSASTVILADISPSMFGLGQFHPGARYRGLVRDMAISWLFDRVEFSLRQKALDNHHLTQINFAAKPNPAIVMDDYAQRESGFHSAFESLLESQVGTNIKEAINAAISTATEQIRTLGNQRTIRIVLITDGNTNEDIDVLDSLSRLRAVNGTGRIVFQCLMLGETNTGLKKLVEESNAAAGLLFDDASIVHMSDSEILQMRDIPSFREEFANRLVGGISEEALSHGERCEIESLLPRLRSNSLSLEFETLLFRESGSDQTNDIQNDTEQWIAQIKLLPSILNKNQRRSVLHFGVNKMAVEWARSPQLILASMTQSQIQFLKTWIKR